MQGVFQTMLVMSRRNFKVIFLVMKCFILILLLFLSVFTLFLLPNRKRYLLSSNSCSQFLYIRQKKILIEKKPDKTSIDSSSG